MRGTVVREPGLELPDLPHGVTEVTIRRNGNVFVTHTRKPWTDVMQGCMRFNASEQPIGGPEIPAKPVFPPPRRRRGVSGLPYKDT